MQGVSKTGVILSIVIGVVAAMPLGWPVLSGAVAQSFQMLGGPGGEGPNSDPPVNSRQLKRYVTLLGLDADQKEAAEALLEGMQAEWQANSAKMRETMDALREEFQQDRDPSVFAEKMPDVIRQQRDTRTKLEKGFMSDFKDLLTEEQMARWPVMERVYRRETTISRGRLSGESVDLVQLADELKIDATKAAEVPEMLEQYEIELDRALVRRNELIDRAQQIIGDGPGAVERIMRNVEGNEEFQKLRGEAKEARLKIREVNQRYARQIASALPSEDGAKFTEEFTRRSFPEVFRNSFANDTIEAALKFEDLTPEQRTALTDLRAAYSAEQERSNRLMMSAIEKYEATDEGYASMLGGGMQFRMMRGDGEEPKNPVDEMRSERREADRKALESIRNLLNDEQRERLPKRRERARGAQAMGGGAEGGPTMVVIGGEDGAPPEGGDVVHVVRSVSVGPDGKPIEHQEVFVGRVTTDGGNPDGEDVEIEVVVPPGTPAPPAPPKAGAKKPTNPD